LFGNEFGRAYRLLDPSDRITSISVSQVGEMVLNFGLIGIAAGMALVGSVYRLIDEALVARRQNPTCLAVFAIVAWPLVMANETIVSLGLCGTLRLLAVFALALLLLRRVHAPRQVIDGAQTSFAASAELRP